MAKEAVRTTERIVSCSDDGQHPLVYLNLEAGRARCPYCSREFVRVYAEEDSDSSQASC